jgi:predicted RNA-binding protein with PUA-like domain
MRVSTRLGDLSLVDDVNLGVAEDSSLRQLVTIQGDELADFRYETFDPSKVEQYPRWDHRDVRSQRDLQTVLRGVGARSVRLC